MRQSQAQIGVISAPICAFCHRSLGGFSVVSVQPSPLFSDSGSKVGQYNTTTDEISIAPVYDCGSSLYPQADEAIMRATLENQPQRDLRTFSLPLSVVKINNQQINYFDFISSLKNADCNRALKRILPKVNINHILRIVDETPFISELQKQFYKTMLT